MPGYYFFPQKFQHSEIKVHYNCYAGDLYNFILKTYFGISFAITFKPVTYLFPLQGFVDLSSPEPAPGGLFLWGGGRGGGGK